MPTKRVKDKPLKDREAFFVKLCCEKMGPKGPDVAAHEKRAHIKAGSGRKILNRKSVKEEIRKRTEAARLEQIRLKTVAEAAAVAKVQLQQELSNTVTKVQRMKIDLEVLDHELMSMAVGLDMRMFPKEKLDAVKAAYVVFGTLESGNTRRLIPPEHLQKNDGQGTYTALFDRLALKGPENALEARQGADQVYDLIPGAIPSMEPAGPLPPPGAPLEESAPPPEDPGVITVDLG